MFTMIPELSFWRRLSLWWSFTWRLTLVVLPIWLVIGAIVVGALIQARHGKSNWLSGLAGSHGAMIGLCVVLILVLGLLSLPIYGYVVRRAFARHKITVPATYRLAQATMLGLTSWGWGIVVSLPINVLLRLVRFMIGKSPGVMAIEQVVLLVLSVIGTLYIVLPRQAWRLRRQAGEPEAR
ncbi:hypothetical protein [Burkholderia gladioli]|uniref:Transmembrane protein n=1 Tax=Burkholderia gladioli TaxID=28095 RepID=A0AB38TRD9_BURGA|nr:hypothetical protein [Burkholderia gladioli]UWX70034.1 hypothetical protein NYZ96_17875 [Burkholderia gladioli]